MLPVNFKNVGFSPKILTKNLVFPISEFRELVEFELMFLDVRSNLKMKEFSNENSCRKDQTSQTHDPQKNIVFFRSDMKSPLFSQFFFCGNVEEVCLSEKSPTCFLNLAISSAVRQSAFAITGTMFTWPINWKGLIFSLLYQTAHADISSVKIKNFLKEIT